MSEKFMAWISPIMICCIIMYHGNCLKFEGRSISQDNESPNFLLGGYFGVHKKGSKSQCGKIDQESGIYLVEAMRYALKKINENNTLYGVKLGFRIMDTCSDIASLRNDMSSMILSGKILGVVGPATSDEALLASSALGVFHIPLISYSASSIDLNDRAKYNNFFRTIPADNIQDRVLVDILTYFNWTYISTVNSHGNYGQRGMDGLIALLAPKGICIATRNVLPESPNKSHFEAVVRNLNADPKAKVVVLFTTAEDTYGLMTAARKGRRRFSWLSSSAWTADKETVRGIEDVAKGAILLNYAGINNKEYMKHFMGLKLTQNRYRWFEEFWEDAFNCTLKKSNSLRQCSGNESLYDSNFYGKYAASSAVIDAVNAFACSFKSTIASYCPGPEINRTLCARTVATIRYRFIMRMRLYYESRCKKFYYWKKFDSQGNYYRDFEVVNFDGKTYKTIGIWKLNSTTKKGEIKIDKSNISWFHGENKAPVSVCSFPCKTGEISIKSATKVCCFTCKSCGQNSYILNNTCQKCGQLEIPNQSKSSCKKLPILNHNNKQHSVILTWLGSVIGIVLNTIVLFLFIKHRDTKIVKSSSRELSFVILAGLYLCFLSPFIFFFKPSKILCGLRRFIFGMSLTVCYTALMLKTNRIYRIFRAANVMVAMPQLVSPQSQIFLCFGLLGVQLLLCVLWVIGIPPSVNFVVYNEQVAEVCKTDIVTVIINLVPCFCMLSISTVYAFKTRKFPKNYNEASSIGLTMYISCFLWALFIPLLLWVKIENKNPFAQIYVITNFMNVIGLVSLFGLFGPKIRRLVFLRKQAIAKVFFSSVNKDHSVNNTVDIDISPARSIDLSTVGTIESEKSERGNEEAKNRSKTL